MPDISLCPSVTCSVRMSCYRNTESGTKETEYRQSLFLNAPGTDKDCKYYWPISEAYDTTP